MAFINEVISDEDKQEVDWSRFIWSKYAPPANPSMWTIDRAQEAFLVRLTGPGRENDHPAMYALSWKGHFIKFSVEIEVVGSSKITEPADLHWKVFEMDIPPTLNGSYKQILELLREAFNAHSRSNPISNITNVYVKFS